MSREFLAGMGVRIWKYRADRRLSCESVVVFRGAAGFGPPGWRGRRSIPLPTAASASMLAFSEIVLVTFRRASLTYSSLKSRPQLTNAWYIEFVH